MDASIWQTKVNRTGKMNNTSETKKEKLQEQLTLNPGTLKFSLMFPNQGCTLPCRTFLPQPKARHHSFLIKSVWQIE